MKFLKSLFCHVRYYRGMEEGREINTVWNFTQYYKNEM